MKTKVLFYNKQIGNGGAEKKLLLFGKHLIKMYDFDVAYLSWSNAASDKISSMGARHFKYSPDNGHRDSIKAIEDYKPDIIHTTRSGEPEEVFDAPLKKFEKSIPIIESNVFGNHGGVYTYKLPISSEVYGKLLSKKIPSEKMEVLHNPIDKPNRDVGNLRNEFKIPTDAFIFGRISRGDDSVYCNLGIRAYEKFIKVSGPGNYYYMSLGLPPRIFKDSIGLYNFVGVPETSNADRVAKFYNTINILVHANKLGESLGTKIQEAMSYGVPVVTHITPKHFKAHISDLLGRDYNYVAKDTRDVDVLYGHMRKLYKDKKERMVLGERFITEAQNRWFPEVIIPKLWGIYKKFI